MRQVWGAPRICFSSKVPGDAAAALAGARLGEPLLYVLDLHPGSTISVFPFARLLTMVFQ